MNDSPFTRPFLKIREAPSEGEVPRYCGGRESPHGSPSLTPGPHPPTCNCFFPLRCSAPRQQDSSVCDLAPFCVPHQTGTSPGAWAVRPVRGALVGERRAGLSPVVTLVPPGHRFGPRRRDSTSQSVLAPGAGLRPQDSTLGHLPGQIAWCLEPCQDGLGSGASWV